MVVIENCYFLFIYCVRRICLYCVYVCCIMMNCIDIILEKKIRKVIIEYVWNVIKVLFILKLKVLGIMGE